MSIVFENVSFSYPGRNDNDNVVILNHTNFIFPDSKRFIGFAGPSGSGKSTVLALIGGLLKAQKGSIKIFDNNLNNLSEKELSLHRLENTGYIFQSFHLIFSLTVLENILVTTWLKNTTDDSQERASYLMDRLGISHLSSAYPNTLSGGEMQRVAIARALIRKPKLIIADEPTGNLDAKNSEKVIDLLISLSEEEGVMVLVASHDPQVLKMTKICYKLNDGKFSEMKL
jgi:putative ABC transport system ATP-binding protein